MERRPVAYQIYSAREQAAQDLPGVLKALADLGYDGVEFAGFYGHSAAEVAELLTRYGLKALSSHVPMADILDDMFGVIAYHRRIGCPYIAVPYLGDDDRPGAKGFPAILRAIYQFGALCREAGIQLLYHNHDFEFVDMGGIYGLDFLYAATPADILQTEIDTCWVHYAGLNPADYIRKYKGRCPVVHLKDYVGKKGDVNPYALIGQADNADRSGLAFEFRPFGHGVQDAASIVCASIESGADWFVIEQDLSVGRTPLEAAQMSIETLRKLGVAKPL
jgi:sugar phosphate isomerase/epimerase